MICIDIPNVFKRIRTVIINDRMHEQKLRVSEELVER
jgi:hypothetical protein